MRLVVKYCGGCNPLINRKKVVEEVVNGLKEHVAVQVTTREGDVLLVLAGCPVCCVGLNNGDRWAGKTVVVGGYAVDCLEVEPAKLVEAVTERILEKEEDVSC